MLFARQSLLSDQQGHFGSSENLAQVAQVFRLKRITSTVQARWSLLYRYIQSVGSFCQLSFTVVIVILLCFVAVELAVELAVEFFLLAFEIFSGIFTHDDIIGLLEAVF